MPSKVAFLVLLGFRNCALTQDKLQETGFRIASRCFCAKITVSQTSLFFFSCPCTKNLWDFFFGGDGRINPRENSLWERTQKLWSLNLTRAGLIYRRVAVHALIWNVWFERNNRIFEEKSRDVEEVWNRVVKCIWDWSYEDLGVKDIRLEDLNCIWGKNYC